jgi:hypothetical protein
MYSNVLNVSMRNRRSITHNQTAAKQCHTWQPTCEGHAQMKRCSRAAHIHNNRIKPASKFTDSTAEICYRPRNDSNKGSISVVGHTASDCSGLRVTVRNGGVGTRHGCVYRCRILALGLFFFLSNATTCPARTSWFSSPGCGCSVTDF